MNIKLIKLLALSAIALGLSMGCTPQKKLPGTGDTSYTAHKQVVNQLIQKKRKQLVDKIQQYKVESPTIQFHRDTTETGGFFKINYQFNKTREAGFFLLVENQNETVFDLFNTMKSAQKEEIVGRYLKPGKITIRVYMLHPELEGEKFLLHTFHYTAPSEKTINREVVKDWVHAKQARYYTYAIKGVQTRHRQLNRVKSEFHQYWIEQAPYRYQLKGDSFFQVDRRKDREAFSVYSILSGASAIRETLQLDAPYAQKGMGRLEVDLKDIKGVTVKSHPFKKMIGQKKPEFSPIASLVPFDNYYVHLSSLSSALELFEMANEKHSLFLGTNDSMFIKNWHIKEKVLKQLGLEVDSMRIKWFGDLLVEELAITGEDPFMNHNTGISLILKVKSASAIQNEVSRIFENVQNTNSSAKVTTSLYRDVPIQSLESPFGKVSSHWAIMGSYAVNSNRLASLKRIIDVHNKRSSSMVENDDFHYMRTIFKGNSSKEDMFVYLSDAFIRKMVTPRWVIGKVRRLTCASDLKNINNAILMRRKDNRPGIPTVQQLLDERYLQPRHLGCYAKDMTVNSEGVAYSPTVGTLSNLIPIHEIPITRVAVWEDDVYYTFKRDYESLWSEFFDPIGIRVRLDDQIHVETVILPLIDNTIYQLVKKLVSNEPIKLEESESDQVIATVGISLNNNRMIDEMTESLSERVNLNLSMRDQKPIELFGNKLVVKFHDHDLLFNINPSFLMQRTQLFRGNSLFYSILFSALNLPVSVSVDLKEPDRFYEMGGVELMLWGLTGNRLFEDASFDRVIPYQGQSIYQLSIKLWAMELKFYVAQVEDQLVIATKRYLIEEQLKKRLEMLAKNKKPAVHSLNAGLIVKPQNFNRILPQMEEGFISKISQVSHNNLRALEAFVTPQYSGQLDLQAESAKYFGYTLDSLFGETYQYDPVQGNVTSSVFNWIYSHTIPEKLSPAAKASFKAEKLKKMKIFFNFTPEGIRTKMIMDR